MPTAISLSAPKNIGLRFTVQFSTPLTGILFLSIYLFIFCEYLILIFKKMQDKMESRLNNIDSTVYLTDYCYDISVCVVNAWSLPYIKMNPEMSVLTMELDCACAGSGCRGYLAGSKRSS